MVIRHYREEKTGRDFGWSGYTPHVLQKSAEATDWKRVVEILFFEECGRI